MAIVSEITVGFKARLENVLDQVCIEAPDGGSHEMRCIPATIATLVGILHGHGRIPVTTRGAKHLSWLP